MALFTVQGIRALPTDSLAYINFIGRTSGIDSTHQTAYKTLLNGLTNAGLFNSDGSSSYLDILYMFATQDSTTSLLNLVNNSFNGVLIGSGAAPTFTADQGYTCSTSGAGNQGVNTGYNPSTAGKNLTLNSASIGSYIRTSSTTAQYGVSIGGFDATNTIWLYPLNPDVTAIKVNVNAVPANTAFANSNMQGNYVVSRQSSTQTTAYKNESSISTQSENSTALPNANIYALALNDHGTPDSQLGGIQIASVFVGAGLSSTQANQIANLINQYMTVLGTNVY